MWLRLSFAILLLGTCFLVSACGFEPQYGAQSSSAATQGQMIVEDIPGREGQIFKIALEDTLNPQSESVLNAPYSVRATLRSELIPAVVADDASIRRYNVLLTVQFAVIDRATAKPLYQGSARRYGSYSRSHEDFSTFVANEDVVKRTLEELAKDVAQRLASLKLAPAGTRL